jgi:hypothetical protein
MTAVALAQERNLWPIVLLTASPVALVYVTMVALLARRSGTPIAHQVVNPLTLKDHRRAQYFRLFLAVCLALSLTAAPVLADNAEEKTALPAQSEKPGAILKDAKPSTLSPLGLLVGVAHDGKLNNYIIDKLDAAGPAAKAGLRERDVILRVNDLRVDDPEKRDLTMQALSDMLVKAKMGDKVAFHVQRKDKEQTSLATVTVVAVPVVIPQGDEKARQLFQKMEQQLGKAKTLECVFETKVENKGGERETAFHEGTVFLAQGNQGRMDERPKGATKGGNSCPINAASLPLMARVGFGLYNAPWPPVEADGVDDRCPTLDFRLGDTEKIGEQEAQRLEYRFIIKGQKDQLGQEAPFSVTLWLDTTTSLPVKRVVCWPTDGLTITERYTTLVLNGTVDPKKFDLPK